jgi:hypothetical protein
MCHNLRAVSTTEPSTPGQVPPDPAEAVSGPENASQGTSEGTPGAPEGERGESGVSLSPEMRYRLQLREAERERDSLREQVNRLQTAEVERLAAHAGLAVAGDVWQFGATLDTLRAEDGSIDHDTVSGVVGDILRSRPGLQAMRNPIGIGRGMSAAPRNNHPPVGLSQLLKP